MNDPLQALLQGPAKPSLFPPNSRYAGIDTATVAAAGGKTIVYLRRRFVPPPETFALLQEYTVVQGDRLDNIAAKFVGDPERFWQIADANAAMAPEELTEIVGRTLRITLPEGIPGTSNG
jgi:nucleoid-associated protein YgaU